MKKILYLFIVSLLVELALGVFAYSFYAVILQKEPENIMENDVSDEEVIENDDKPDVVVDDNSGEKEKIAGDYEWQDSAAKAQYSGMLWNKIDSSKVAGFSVSVVEKKTDGCIDDFQTSYLRIEGGLCGIGYWLEDGSGQKIDSLEKLKARFLPIVTQQQAVSFVAVTQKDLQINAGGIPEGHAIKVTDGFLVQLVRKNTFGCGSHEPTGVIFKVTGQGEVLMVASQKPKPDGGPVLCVD